MTWLDLKRAVKRSALGGEPAKEWVDVTLRRRPGCIEIIHGKPEKR